VSVHLKEKGVKVNKIYVEGKGESNAGFEKSQNRRVDVVVHLEN
jgi:outer membrane protein OmpA-like peptidoglycan-associated protein